VTLLIKRRKQKHSSKRLRYCNIYNTQIIKIITRHDVCFTVYKDPLIQTNFECKNYFTEILETEDS